MRDGYNEKFLDDEIVVPLPKPNLEIDDDVLRLDTLHEGYIANYIHYSVVMSKSNRQAFFSAANIDQDTPKQVTGRNWFIDSRVGKEFQIGPEAYGDNPWDKGHLTRRTAVTWGSNYEAKRASNDSCSYSNACFQHENFNRDEWRVPEEVVHHFKKDKNNKLCVFTGPVFTQTDRWYTRRSLHEKVRIPTGFWKVIAYIGEESGKLESQAYVMFQDTKFLADRSGGKKIEEGNYQVTMTEVERLTGLEFVEELYNANPLYFHPRENINEGPEGFKTPRGISDEELKSGIVFSRDDAEKSEFASRKRVIREEEFEERASLMDF